MQSNLKSESWGYKYIGPASDHLICYLEGRDTLDNYPSFQERHARADELLAQLLGLYPSIFYIRRHQGSNPTYELWDLTLATDIDEFQISPKLLERQQTLKLWATVPRDGRGHLGLKRIHLVEFNLGEHDSYSVPIWMQLVPENFNPVGIPLQTFQKIQEMPVCGENVPTYEQKRTWGKYLAIERRTAEKRQFCVPITSSNLQSDRSLIIEINPESATRNGSVSLTPTEFWQRAERARNGRIQFHENTNRLEHRYTGEELGEIEKIEKRNNSIQIQLNPRTLALIEDEEDSFEIPQEGYLFFQDIGSIVQIQRQEKALRNLLDGHTHNVRLGDFFFDTTQAKPLSQLVSLLNAELLLSEINDSQRAAVEAVLSAEDLVLVQGPPGTGKTTVIAEICYQVARRGGRTLIASQANLAVDNALSRLKHHPILRPLRAESSGQVGKEGQIFLADKVLERWLDHTAADCENRLLEPRQIVKNIGNLLKSVDRFTAYRTLEQNFSAEQEKLLKDKRNLESILKDRQSELEEVSLQVQNLESFKKAIKNFMFVGSYLNGDDPSVETLLNQLNSYVTENKIQLIELRKIEQCQQIANRLDLDLPSYPKLGLAFWFRYVIPEELQTAITYANRTIAAINAIERQREWDLLSEIVGDLERLISNNYRGMRGAINEFIDWIRSLLNRSTPKARLRAIRERYAVVKNQRVSLNLDRAGQDIKYFVTLPQVPDSWQNLAQKYLNQPNETQFQLFEEEISIWKLDAEKLLKLCLSLNLLPNAIAINDCIHIQLIKLKEKEINLSIDIKYNQEEIQEIDRDLARRSRQLEQERTWWQSIWLEIPEHLKSDPHDKNYFNPEFLSQIPLNFEIWQRELKDAETYLNRYESILQNWIDRLRNPSEQDLATFTQKYLENVNVVGITCIKAAKWAFSQTFSNFDVVIIDEVSKSTPPELLIPALKGKKIVMIGDYRQLPPILDEENLDELAEEISQPIETLQFLERSWFQLQYEAAKSIEIGITQKLNCQYRMHPQIMEAINQFYDEGDGGLICGLSDPDRQRAHGLSDDIFKENNHIMWLKLPIHRDYSEKRNGTSYENKKEVECIEKICHQINELWSDKVNNGEPKKDIGIITFYGAQLRLINNRINSKRFINLDIRTGTVDRFQGMEKPIIIVSMVRNNNQKKVGFAKTPERVNVAFSRAKELLIIVGCHQLFTTIPIYQEVSNVVERYRGFIDGQQFIN